ncbi:MAG: hypothetical protein M1319_01370 [Chloroflexi bacterium]|nr:hypothetical protein [Chloroflexota bacterium]
MPSLAGIIFILLILLIPSLRADSLLNSDGDLARHITVGDYILDSGSIPQVDLFSHTRSGDAFVPYEWLSEVGYAVAYRSLGLSGVGLLASAVIALTFYLLMRFQVTRGVHPLLALILTLLAALASSIHWLARPHLFTTLLALVFFWILERYWERGGRLVFAVPVLMVVWANLHGGFLVGFIVIGIFLASALLQMLTHGARDLRRVGTYAVVLIFSLAAILVNPAGYKILPHVMSYFGNKWLVANTVEYMSPDFHQSVVWFFLGLLLLTVVSLVFSKRRTEVRHLAVILVFTAFALYSARNIPLFAVLVTPLTGLYLYHRLSELWLADAPHRLAGRVLERLKVTARNIAAIDATCSRSLAPLLGLVLAVAIAWNGGYLGKTQIWGLHFDPTTMPVKAADFVQAQRMPGLMFNDLGWGGYLLYRLYPEYKVFIDGQTDFYGEELSKEWATVDRVQPGWREVLNKYDVNWIIMPTGSQVDVLLQEVKDWRLVYRDKTAVIYVRNTPENAGIRTQISS